MRRAHGLKHHTVVTKESKPSNLHALKKREPLLFVSDPQRKVVPSAVACPVLTKPAFPLTILQQE